MRSGIFTFETPNLGDDLQSLVAAHLRPRQSFFLRREWIWRRQTPEPVSILMNYWFTSGRMLLAPHSSVAPIYHGFSMGKEAMLKWGWLKHLKSHEPIGCRDTATVRTLQAVGIEGYWSGCATMFLGAWYKPVRNSDGPVLFIDVPPSAEPLIPRALTERAVRLSNACPESLRRDPLRRQARIARINDVIRTASMIVTKRLHTALPAASFGIPVVLIVENRENDRRRFSGYEQFLPIIFHEHGKALNTIDWQNVGVPVYPDEIHRAFERLRERLRVTLPSESERRPCLTQRLSIDIPNPGLGAEPGDLFIEMRNNRCNFESREWTDRRISFSIDTFADVADFEALIKVRRYKSDEVVTLGRLLDFATVTSSRV